MAKIEYVLNWWELKNQNLKWMKTAFVEIEIYIGEGKHTPVWELICELLEDIGKQMPIVSNICRKSPLKF